MVWDDSFYDIYPYYEENGIKYYFQGWYDNNNLKISCGEDMIFVAREGLEITGVWSQDVPNDKSVELAFFSLDYDVTYNETMYNCIGLLFNYSFSVGYDAVDIPSKTRVFISGSSEGIEYEPEDFINYFLNGNSDISANKEIMPSYFKYFSPTSFDQPLYFRFVSILPAKSETENAKIVLSDIYCTTYNNPIDMLVSYTAE